MIRILTLVAEVEVPAGAPVADGATPDGCRPTADLSCMRGVARRPRHGGNSWAPGEVVQVQAEGGIRANLLADATVTVRGRDVRLLAQEPNYLELAGGKVAGFSGDREIC